MPAYELEIFTSRFCYEVSMMDGMGKDELQIPGGYSFNMRSVYRERRLADGK
jgi:hypothetical protein